MWKYFYPEFCVFPPASKTIILSLLYGLHFGLHSNGKNMDLKLLVKWLLSRVYGPKKEEVVGSWRNFMIYTF
jgi:hypothetical protein